MPSHFVQRSTSMPWCETGCMAELHVSRRKRATTNGAPWEYPTTPRPFLPLALMPTRLQANRLQAPRLKAPRYSMMAIVKTWSRGAPVPAVTHCTRTTRSAPTRVTAVGVQ